MREYIRETGKHERHWWYKWKRECSGERKPSRKRVLALLNEYNINCPQAKAIANLCHPNIYWAKVSSITHSLAEVYDLCVPDDHEFIAHGFINHNTFVTRTIVQLWKSMGKSIALAAPTGRATQRLSEMTGLEAKTVHRLLEFDPKGMGFKRDEHNPLPQKALIVDEASMLDLFLAYSLIKAVPKDGQILFVGDVDQLPSVGPGKVLADLINSGKVPVVCLTQVFRQAASSKIIKGAHQINQGYYPDIEPISDTPISDCLWHGGGHQPEHGVQAISELITNFIPARGFNPRTDVQLLCPMSRGLVGTRNLNKVLQELINPPSPEKIEIKRGETIFRTNDRVIQLTNDYQREVFNGDVGFITDIDTEEQEVIVCYQGRDLKYDYADLNEIALVWSVTIHKSQGSEYPVVILPYNKKL